VKDNSVTGASIAIRKNISGRNLQRYIFIRENNSTPVIIGSLVIDADVWPLVVRPLGYDAGIRTLQRTIQSLVRQTALNLVTGQHQLLHLTVHALRHHYDRLILLWDIHQVINHYGGRLNWKELVQEALEFRLFRPLFYGLYLTKLLMHTDVPQHVLDRLRPLSLGLEEKAFVYFINRGIRIPGLQYLVYFPMNQGVINKIRFLWRAFFPPRDILAEMEALDGSEIGIVHYLRCMSWRMQCAWRLIGGGYGFLAKARREGLINRFPIDR